MTMRFAFPDSGAPPRGAAPVGYLDELPALERAAILALRGLCGDRDDQARVAEWFEATLGATAGSEAIVDLVELIGSALIAARRPVMRHGLECRCFGGDECIFAQMIAAAAGQDRDEAALFAIALVTAPAAYDVVRLAVSLGPALLQVSRNPFASAPPGPASVSGLIH